MFVRERLNVDAFVREWLAVAQTLGHSVADVREALDRLAASSSALLVVDPDAELARILAAELSEALGVSVGSSGVQAAVPENTAVWIQTGQAIGPIRVLKLDAMMMLCAPH